MRNAYVLERHELNDIWEDVTKGRSRLELLQNLNHLKVKR